MWTVCLTAFHAVDVRRELQGEERLRPYPLSTYDKHVSASLRFQNLVCTSLHFQVHHLTSPGSMQAELITNSNIAVNLLSSVFLSPIAILAQQVCFMALSLSACIITPHSGVLSPLSSNFFPRTQRLSAACKSAPLRKNAATRSTRCGVATDEIQEDGVLSVPSLYGLLGLDQNVDLNKIKNAYRQMARRYHPDVCPVSKREECTRMFLQVQDAYEILSDPERRAEYDYYLMHPLSANAYGLGNLAKSKRSTRARVDSVSEAWKMQWQAHLSRLEMKAREEQFQPKTSWGAQMRSRAAQS